MGRPGGGGGGSRSGGGHSSSRSSGGHRVGGNSRAGSSRSGSSYRSSSYNHSHSHSYGGGYYGSSRHYRSGGGSPLATVLAFVAIVVLAILFDFMSEPKSSYSREKINTGVPYQNDCIVDELGWFDNETKAEKNLQQFYNKTGVQPYIVLADYDSSLTSDSDKEAWANQYYEENIDNESTFLYVYFEESNPDDVGYMCYVNGKQVTSVMDAEAIDIFWGYLDNNWYKDISTDDMFVNTFKSTADTIMTKSATMQDVMIWLVAGVVVIVVCVIGFKALKAKFKRDKEEAEETERILNTSLDELSRDPEAESIVDKYN